MLITQQLAARLEGAVVDQQVGTSLALAALDPGGTARHLRVAGGALLYGGPGMYVNRGMGLGLRERVTSQVLGVVESFYEGVGAPPELELCPHAVDLDDVLDATAARHWSPVSLRPTFVLDPARQQAAGPDRSTATFSEVDEVTLAVWQEVLATGFGQRDAVARAISDRFSAGAHRTPGAVDLLIEVAGRPAGACSVTIGRNGVAWLGGTTVLAEHREQGLQRVALDHRVALARDAGCDVVAVGALHGGTSYRNVQRAGFTPAWTNVVLRRRLPEPPVPSPRR